MKRLPVLQSVQSAPRAIALAAQNATKPNRDGSPWYARVFRLTTTRIITQAFCFGLFIFLLWVTWFSRLGGYPASLFLELDPLVTHRMSLDSINEACEITASGAGGRVVIEL